MSRNDYLRIASNAKILSKPGDNPVVMQLPQGLYGVITCEGNIVVPFGKYDLIEEFCLGITRVKKGKVTNGIKNSYSKWGIIDTAGRELLSVIYDDIWNSKLGRLRLEKDGNKVEISISQIIKK